MWQHILSYLTIIPPVCKQFMEILHAEASTNDNRSTQVLIMSMTQDHIYGVTPKRIRNRHNMPDEYSMLKKLWFCTRNTNVNVFSAFVELGVLKLSAYPMLSSASAAPGDELTPVQPSPNAASATLPQGVRPYKPLSRAVVPEQINELIDVFASAITQLCDNTNYYHSIMALCNAVFMHRSISAGYIDAVVKYYPDRVVQYIMRYEMEFGDAYIDMRNAIGSYRRLRIPVKTVIDNCWRSSRDRSMVKAIIYYMYDMPERAYDNVTRARLPLLPVLGILIDERVKHLASLNHVILNISAMDQAYWDKNLQKCVATMELLSECNGFALIACIFDMMTHSNIVHVLDALARKSINILTGLMDSNVLSKESSLLVRGACVRAVGDIAQRVRRSNREADPLSVVFAGPLAKRRRLAN